MDKNIAAILREDAKTISVQFINSRGIESLQAYTYITHLDVQVEDKVIVPTGEEESWKVAVVKEVHDDLDIEPNSDIKYKWVVDVINEAEHKANMARNSEIERVLAMSYRTHARAAYAQQFLAGADPKVLELVKGKQNV